MSEHEEQVAVFEWAEVAKQKYPELELLFAVPNGGLRHVVVAKKLKAEGVKSGVPDIVLPVPKSEFHGLFIELKYGKNKPSENQKRWATKLTQQGYCVALCYGAMEAIAQIKLYLELKE